jgi:GT2 family glycosyltransferase
MHDHNIGIRIGIVVIGRNEGDRLTRCLRSASKSGAPVVYVDSGSTDDSVTRARDLGATVVELDPSKPFTAARGRNEGFQKLRALHPEIELVQFLDGDTELYPRWIERAAETLTRDRTVTAVCGRRREREIDQSIYNLLCDMEWNTPVGDAHAFGGDVMIRACDFEDVGGYDASLIAGEDPDLAVRLRQRGKRIVRLDEDMTLHDAALHRFSQWWTRAKRGGHAYAEGAHRHGDSPQRHWVKETRSNWLWGAGVPLFGAMLFLPSLGTSAVASSSAYAVLLLKIYRDCRRRGMSAKEARIYATFATLAKIPQALGQATYWWRRLRGRATKLIEYK